LQDYSKSFQDTEAAKKYEEIVYGTKSHDSFIWSLQKKCLISIVENLKRCHESLIHLDFACGTGRVISVLDGITEKSTGLDISKEMIEIAQEKVKKSDLLVGNILEEPEIVDSNYDLITTFRFFLNAEPELRESVMRSLSSRLRDKDSRLIFSIQGNSQSFRHLSIACRNWKGEQHHEMSLRDVRRLVEDAGLVIESWYGFGVSPALLHRTMLSPLVKLVDRVAIKLPVLKRFSYDLLFVCKRKV